MRVRLWIVMATKVAKAMTEEGKGVGS